MEKKYITISNKEQIAYYDINPSASNILVAIHGNFSSSLYFSPLFKNIPSQIRIIAPDLRGYGDSSYINRFDTLKELAEDINELLDKLNIKTYSLMGWSLGGGVAMELAALTPKKVSHLILLSSTTHRGYPIYKKDEKGQPIFSSHYMSKDEMATDPIQVLPMVNILNSKDFNTLSYIYDVTIYTGIKKPDRLDNEKWINESLKQRCIIDADWALATQNMSSIPTAYNKGDGTINNITSKVLHIWGDKDIVSLKYMIEENQNALKEKSTLIIYGGCGHSALVDNPKTLTSDIYNFIK